jgi:hypothetical protein
MNTRISRIIFLVVLLTSALCTNPSVLAHPDSGQRCFHETGYCMSGRIRAFWEQNGGLPVFGFPITPQVQTRIEGMVVPVQWFERARLEVHAENPAPYDVLLGRLGNETLHDQGRDWLTGGASPQGSDCRFFHETQHNICGAILQTWHQYGLEFDGQPETSEAENLALFGLPITELIPDVSTDGQVYMVQWFERARFELHPENVPPYHVLLGLLGTEQPAGQARPLLARITPPMQGDAVLELQQRLSDLGYAVGPIDGVYGAQTEAGVRNFQYANYLDVDGIVGPATWTTLLAPGPQHAGE